MEVPLQDNFKQFPHVHHLCQHFLGITYWGFKMILKTNDISLRVTLLEKNWYNGDHLVKMVNR